MVPLSVPFMRSARLKSTQKDDLKFLLKNNSCFPRNALTMPPRNEVSEKKQRVKIGTKKERIGGNKK